MIRVLVVASVLATALQTGTQSKEQRPSPQPARPTAGEIGTAEAKTRLEEYMRSWQAMNAGFLHVREGTGKLGINKTLDWQVDLAGGIEYVFLGAGDNGAQDIDFTLKAMGSDTVLLQDVDDDALPVIRFTPAATGTFVLTVRMLSCAGESCNLHVVLLAKSGSPKQ